MLLMLCTTFLDYTLAPIAPKNAGGSDQYQSQKTLSHSALISPNKCHELLAASFHKKQLAGVWLDKQYDRSIQKNCASCKYIRSCTVI